ncbi:MAG: sporulation protein [Haloarculaceae archaeon]
MGLLSRVGIGSATVDTILETDRVQPGDAIDAHVEIEGGSEEQEVDDLEIGVATAYQVPTDDDDFTYKTAQLSETELTDGFTIEPDEQRTLDIPPIEIPETTPPTIDQTSVWVQTGLDIDWSVDPTDEDHLTVEPGPYTDALLSAIENLGLSMEMADNVKSGFGPGQFAQFFEYENYGTAPWSNLDDIEFFVAPRGDHLTVEVDVESRNTSLLERSEQRTNFRVDSRNADAVESTVRSVIDSNVK